MTNAAAHKLQAALRAVAQVASGMTVGLGSGSTAHHAIQEIGRRLASGELHDIRGVATSEASARLAREWSIPLVDLEARGVDIAIDGIDEVTERGDAIKGLGGALTREKIVAARAERFILIGDSSKLVAALGKAPVPVEVIRFGWRAVQADLEALGCEVTLRQEGGQAFVTDNAQVILDCRFRGLEPACAAAEIARLPGVVEHGLFLNMAHEVYIASDTGVRELRP